MSFLLALLVFTLLPVTSAMSVNEVKLTRKDIRRTAREEQQRKMLCRRFYHKPTKIAPTLASNKYDREQLRRVSYNKFHGENGCKKDQTTALELAKQLMGNDPLFRAEKDSVEHYARLLRDTNDAKNRPYAAELQRIYTLKGGYSSFMPEAFKWSDDERRDFYTRDDVWAYLQEHSNVFGAIGYNHFLDGLLDEKSPRFDAKRGVELVEKSKDTGRYVQIINLLLHGAGGLPRDDARIMALLAQIAPYQEEARSMLIYYTKRQLRSAEASEVMKAKATLSSFAISATPSGKEARDLLLPFHIMMLDVPDLAERYKTVRTLTDYAKLGDAPSQAVLLEWAQDTLKSGTTEDKSAAWGALSSLINMGNKAAYEILAKDMAGKGGIVDIGRLTLETSNIAKFIGQNDYPPSAIRREEEGIVELEVIIAPDGRLVGVLTTKDPSPSLSAAASSVALRRLRKLSSPVYPGRYQKAKLPPIQFRLAQCENGPKLRSAVEGAIVVDSYCRATNVHYAPIAVHTET